MRKPFTEISKLAITVGIAISTQAAAQTRLPETTVTGQAVTTGLDIEELQAEKSSFSPDVADWVKSMPGADVNGNGPLSGIVQYRGMFGERVKVLLDGVEPVAGCSNHMDPPLHYTASGLIDSLEMERGITPISKATETFGGFVQAIPKTQDFTDSPEYSFKGSATLAGQTVDSGGSGSVQAAMVNNRYRFGIAVSMDKGDDYKFPGGTVRATEYYRYSYGLDIAHQGTHNWSLGAEKSRSEDTGTPALPMDILYSDGEIYKGRYSSNVSNGEFFIKAGAMDVTHVMTNYSLRPAPMDKTRWRSSKGVTDGRNFTVGFNGTAMGGNFTTGVDGVFKKITTVISNPNNAMFYLDAFNDAKRDIGSLFFEWDGMPGGSVESNLGIRYNRVSMDANEVDGTPAKLMPAAASLRDEFNAADRTKNDDNIDVALNFAYPATHTTRLTLGLGHKTHSPTYQQRYLWIPLQSTGGLADGNNYVGDVNLKPEQAWQLDAGVEWQTTGGSLLPRVYYQRINDYIQGVPATDQRVIMVSTMSGDPTPLQFANVDAEIYGIDLYWNWNFNDDWGLEGTASYTRGKRRDIDDNLYRISPPNARTALLYTPSNWTFRLENVAYARQNKVSQTNGEKETAGYGLLNLSARYDFKGASSIGFGVSNLLDKEYRNNLNGVNRVSDSDVAIGETLPGRGRSAFVNVRFDW